MKERVPFYDSLKFVLIFFVIAGHAIEKYIDLNDFNKGLYHFIYLFHMPLFIFVSGFFHKKFDWASCRKSSILILETYILVQLVWFIINGNYSIMALLKPGWTLWYLLSLVWWRFLATFLVPKIQRKYLFSLSVIISLLWGFFPYDGNILSVSRTIIYFPFYLLGIYTTNTEILKIRKWNKFIGLGIMGLALAFVGSDYVLEFPGFKHLLWGSRAFVSINADMQNIFLMKIVTMLFAFLLGAAVINLVPDKQSWSKLGKATLFFYIYHTFFIKTSNLFIFNSLNSEWGGANLARNNSSIAFFGIDNFTAYKFKQSFCF